MKKSQLIRVWVGWLLAYYTLSIIRQMINKIIGITHMAFKTVRNESMN